MIGGRRRDDSYDVVIVGARAAGATLAVHLACAGWRVALVTHELHLGDEPSAQILFPDTLAELDTLGVLDRLRTQHDLVDLGLAWRAHGHEVAGTFSPFGSYDTCLVVRRPVFEGLLLETAQQCSARLISGAPVQGLLGSGTVDDPVRGVVLANGRRLKADLVVGAQRSAFPAFSRLLPSAFRPRRQASTMYLHGHWRGVPASPWCRFDVLEDTALLSAPLEDGLHLISVAVPAVAGEASAEDDHRRYLELLGAFPKSLPPTVVAEAQLVSTVVRIPGSTWPRFSGVLAGHGWALLSDVEHVGDWASAQIPAPAMEQSREVADALLTGRSLTTFRARADGRGRSGDREPFWAEARADADRSAFAWVAGHDEARQTFLDTFTGLCDAAEVQESVRRSREQTAMAIDDVLERTLRLVEMEPSVGSTTPATTDIWNSELVAAVGSLAAHCAEAARWRPSEADLPAHREWTHREWIVPLVQRLRVELPPLIRSAQFTDVASLRQACAALHRAVGRAATEQGLVGCLEGPRAVYEDDPVPSHGA